MKREDSAATPLYRGASRAGLSNQCVAEPLPPGRLTADVIRALNTYDFMAHIGKTVINPGGSAGREHVLNALRPRPGSRVLEIGCGTGHAACLIAERYDCHVTAVDIAPKMVESARAVVEARGLRGRVHCEVGDITALPFDDARFDHVLWQAVLMFVDKPRAIAEIGRVLRPGGRCAGLEFSWKRPPPPPVRDHTYRICGCRTLEFHDAPEWSRTLSRAGLASVTASEQPFTMLSIPGFVRDEGVANSLRIFGRVARRWANVQRMSEIWRHFARHRDYFSYVVLSAGKGG
jgi:ubiquinone/menaquinone biosynthesis C-methylase UbiE